MNTADVDAFTVTLTVCSSCDQPKHDQVESVQVGKFYFDLSSILISLFESKSFHFLSHSILRTQTIFSSQFPSDPNKFWPTYSLLKQERVALQEK